MPITGNIDPNVPTLRELALAGPYAAGAVGGRSRYSTVPIGSVAYGSSGTSTTPTAGTTYFAELFLPRAIVLTGAAVLNGSTAATDLLIYGLYNTVGELVANTALDGTLAANSDTAQAIAFTATYSAAPGRYWLAWQTNGTTTRVRTIAASTFIDCLTGSVAGTFATLPTITIPTTITATVGPIGYVYA